MKQEQSDEIENQNYRRRKCREKSDLLQNSIGYDIHARLKQALTNKGEQEDENDVIKQQSTRVYDES